jgi:bifunctional NMN adenylyltransferase/nudix hydrolase
MKEKTTKIDVGIIIGRLQVHKLHSAHIELIDSVKNSCDKVIILLGLSPLRNTFENPLDFRSRKIMIQETYPDIDVYYIDDNRDDVDWSKNVDTQIRKWLNPNQTVKLFGSRDSFLPHYKGKFPVCELEATTFISGTEIRKQICNNYHPSIDYRAGMIAGTANRYPTAYTTIDIAVINDKQEILLVKKPNEKNWRFIGGFSDVNSNSLEEDARREVSEETGVSIGDPQYVGSTQIADWRYRSSRDKIKTILFVATYISGRPEGADDVEAAKWFKIADLKKTDLVEEHGVLFDMFKKKFPSETVTISLYTDTQLLTDAQMP